MRVGMQAGMHTVRSEAVRGPFKVSLFEGIPPADRGSREIDNPRPESGYFAQIAIPDP